MTHFIPMDCIFDEGEYCLVSQWQNIGMRLVFRKTTRYRHIVNVYW